MEKEAQACEGDPQGSPGGRSHSFTVPLNVIFTEKTQHAITCPLKLREAEVRTRSPLIISQRTLQWWMSEEKELCCLCINCKMPVQPLPYSQGPAEPKSIRHVPWLKTGVEGEPAGYVTAEDTHGDFQWWKHGISTGKTRRRGSIWAKSRGKAWTGNTSHFRGSRYNWEEGRQDRSIQ